MVIVVWGAQCGCRTVGCAACCLCWLGWTATMTYVTGCGVAGAPQHTELARRNNRLQPVPASRHTHTTTTNTTNIQSSAILWKSYCNEWFDVFSERFDITTCWLSPRLRLVTGILMLTSALQCWLTGWHSDQSKFSTQTPVNTFNKSKEDFIWFMKKKAVLWPTRRATATLSCTTPCWSSLWTWTPTRTGWLAGPRSPRSSTPRPPLPRLEATHASTNAELYKSGAVNSNVLA